MGFGKKVSGGSLLALLGVVFTAAIVVAAVVVLSNTLVVKTTVVEPPIALSFEESGVNIYPELEFASTDASGALCTGTMYAGTVYETAMTMQSVDGVDGLVRVKFIIEGEGIQADDIIVQYWEDYGTPGWRVLTMTDEGDMLVGYFGPSTGFPVGEGYDATTDLRVNFVVAGDYTASLYVEPVI